MKYIAYTLPTVFLLPLVALGQPSAPPTNFGYIGGFFLAIITFINNILVPLVFAIALLVFLYGMFLYFIKGGASESEREKGQQLALWAIIGFVLMVSIWGIVNIVASGLFGGSTTAPELPKTPGGTV